MKLLKDILYRAGLLDVMGSTNIAITSVHLDSRKVKKYSLFVAIKGGAMDGHEYIDKAIASGAIAVVCEELPEKLNDNVTYVRVKNSRFALAWIANNFYDSPSSKLKLIGITGTNGKTTVATLLYNLFKNLGYKAGLISTVVYKVDKREVSATHTTPDPLALNELLAQMVETGCSHCFMEVSSHAVDQDRITGLDFAGGVFTNITHDHLDYHKTFDNYIEAKQKFFTSLKPSAFALSNKDDKNGAIMLQNSKANRKFYGLKTMSDFKCKVLENQLTGLMLSIDGNEVVTKLIGTFNAYNILAVYGVAVLLGEPKLNVLTGISTLNPVDGRFQFIKTPNKIIGVVDYAHTPDALKNVLENIKSLRTGNETLITVVGCGGDRDKTKRPIMRKVATDFSNKVILTSDNPRTEKPEAIIEDMKEGMDPLENKKTIVIVDRKEAIRTACLMAQPGDIILVAGKGHEKYQEIDGVRHPFDDMQVLTENLKAVC